MPARGQIRSTDPHAIRTRLRRTAAYNERDFNLLVESGAIKPLDQWDLEELAFGYVKRKDGQFGHRPRWATQVVQAECRRRLKERALDKVSANIDKAIQVLVKLLDDEDPSIRLRSVQLVLEYTLGKPKVDIDIQGRVEMHQWLASSLVLPSGENAHPVIDGQFEDKEDVVDDAE